MDALLGGCSQLQAPARTVLQANDVIQLGTTGITTSRLAMLSPLPVRSVHGENSTAPAGIGFACSFKAMSKATESPPPAESPGRPS